MAPGRVGATGFNASTARSSRADGRRRPALLALGLAVAVLFVVVEWLVLRSYDEVSASTAAFEDEVTEVTDIATAQRELLLLSGAVDRWSTRADRDGVERQRSVVAIQLRRAERQFRDTPTRARRLDEIATTMDRVDTLLAAVGDGPPGDEELQDLRDQFDRADASMKELYDAEETEYFGAVGSALDERSSTRDLLAWSSVVLAGLGIAYLGLSRRAHNAEAEAAYLAVQASESRYRTVVEGARDVIFSIDPTGNWTFLSRSWESLTGFSVDATLGQPFFASVAEDDHAGCPQRFAALMSGEIDELRAEVRYRTRVGGPVWVEVFVRRDPDGPGAVGTLVDVSERRVFEQRLQDLALYDPLTGLANRVLLNDLLHAALARSERNGTRVAVLFLDLDRFKLINDSLGHDRGDELLVAVGSRITDALRAYDTAARLGGDEFVIVCEELDADRALALAQARQVSERLEHAIRRPFDLSNREVIVSTSVGIAIGESGTTPDEMLGQADAAMYQAKDQGKGRHEVFDDTLRLEADSALETEHDLRRAVERNEFRLRYQPIFDATTNRMVSCEALLRWQHPVRGLLAPGAFIDVAEDMGLMREIGRWVIDTALDDLRSWLPLIGDDPFTVAVNLSARQLAAPTLSDELASALSLRDLGPERLVVEITENHVLDADERTIATLREIDALGVALAMDDFGTGYSSLSFLRRLPVSVLKIDRTFVDRLGDDDDDTRIVELVIGLGRSLGLTVVAEGVEEPRQHRMLRALGCDRMQGYLLGRPQAAGQLATLFGGVVEPEGIVPAPQT